LRPGRELVDRDYYAPETISYWRRAIARAQLEATERNLTLLDQVRATATGFPWRFWRGAAVTATDFDRLRAGILERGFEWQKALK
jgi:hypothetical protein